MIFLNKKTIAVLLSMGMVLGGCGSAVSDNSGKGNVTTVMADSALAGTGDGSSAAMSEVSGASSGMTNENGMADGEEIEQATRDVFAMDTYMSITAYGYGDTAEKAVDAAAAEVERLDDLLSTGKETSEISKINASGGGTLSDDSAYMMNYALQLYNDTEGSYDISIYPVMKLWGFTDQNYKVPSDEELKKAMDLVDGSQISFNEETKEISFGKKGMAIDLGSIAKGYTSSRIMKIFEENGVVSGLVNLGGNVQCYKTKTDGSQWKVAIQTPEKDENYLGVIACADKAVITSGGYERYFEENGKSYHHIIDPKTGYPAESGLQSSTIVCSDGTLADGLSTSLFILGKDRAIEYWRSHSDQFDFILLQDDGTLLVTEGIADDFTTDRDMEVVHLDQD